MAASAPSRIFVTSLVLLHCVIVKADVISGQRDITRNVGLVQLAGVNDDVHAVDCGCSDPKYCRQNGWVPSTKVARNREVFGFVGMYMCCPINWVGRAVRVSESRLHDQSTV